MTWDVDGCIFKIDLIAVILNRQMIFLVFIGNFNS